MPDLEVAEALDTTAGVADVDGVVDGTEAQDVDAGAQDVQQDVDAEQNADADAELEDKPVDDKQQADDKGVPAKYKELFAKDKDLRFAYMGYQALRREFPGGVKEARGFRDAVNEAGGVEGITELKADREAIGAMDAQLAAGDPKFIESIANEFGDGFVKLMPHALETFFQKDPAGYNHVVGRIVLNTLNDSPIGEIYDALKADKPEIAQKLAGWYNSIKDLASKVPEKKIDPERQKLEEEKKTFAETKATEFKTSVTNEIRMSNAKDLDAELAKVFKANGKDYADFKKKNPEGCTVMLEQAYKNMLGELNKDKTFVDQHNSLLEKQQRDKLVSAMKSKSQKAIPEAVKKAYRLFNFGATKKAPINGNDKQVTGTVRVAKQPDSGQIDHSRYSSDDQFQSMIFKNQAYIKGRKELVTW